MATTSVLNDLAVVVIGRNEGERLIACLDSVRTQAGLVVYVDSGSTDGSVQAARDRGVALVKLDLSKPFTAARARNEGYRKAIEVCPGIRWVQFVDGDCEVDPIWLSTGRSYLQNHSSVAAVAGRRRERYPDRTLYNRICDMEWEKPVGPTDAFGGDVMLRREALDQSGGYLESLIAGEEPELSLRLRRKGWQLRIVDHEMTLHDADMTQFTQWWKRMKRSGYAYAAGAWLHGRQPERYWVWPAMQAWIWVPAPLLATLVWVWHAGPIGLSMLLIYPAQTLRLFLKIRSADRLLLAVVYTAVRFPEFAGQLEFAKDKITGRAATIIEYK